MTNEETRAVLDAIRDKYGVLTADLLLTEATDENHPLHHRFNWEDKDAAYEYRKLQARQIIRQVVFVSDTATAIPRVRAFHVVNYGKGEYQPLEVFVENPNCLKARIQHDIDCLMRKYSGVEMVFVLLEEAVVKNTRKAG